NREVTQVKAGIGRIANVTTSVSTKLLDGNSPRFDLQVGSFANPEENMITLDLSQNTVQLEALGWEDLDYAQKESAQAGLSQVDGAITHLNEVRSNLGAIQNRLISTLDNLGVQHENLSAANSRIRDTDVAQASSEAIRNQILLQAGTATLV